MTLTEFTEVSEKLVNPKVVWLWGIDYIHLDSLMFVQIEQL